MTKIFPYLLGATLLGLSSTGMAQTGANATVQATELRSQILTNDVNIHAQQLKQRKIFQPSAPPTYSRPTSTASRTIVDPCNLLPNPSFEDQNVSPILGNRFNVYSLGGRSSDELSAWMSTNGSTPDYFATNVPLGNDSNPGSTTVGNFIPHYNDPDPTWHNGTVGLFIRPDDNDQEYITPRAGAIPLTEGAYYAEFYAYRTIYDNNTTKLGLDLRPSSSGDPRSNQVATTYSKTSNSIESSNYVSGAYWRRISGIIRNVSTGSYYVNIGNISPSQQSGSRIAYYLIDDVALFKIPTAGPGPLCQLNTTTVIGEGCPILGATYTWSAPGVTGLPINSSTIQTTVSPTNTTTYTLTVTLPDNSTFSSQVKVYGSQPDAPTATRTYPEYEDCYRVANYLIDNYDPSLSYTVNWVYNATPFPSYPITGNSSSSGTPGTFFVKGGGNSTGSPVSGRFTITMSDPCGKSVTSDIIEVMYACDGPTPGYRPASTITAYPNPASESITVPTGVQGVALVNDKGKMVQKADASGKLDVQSLPDGLYNLQMMQNGKLINQRIQVKH